MYRTKQPGTIQKKHSCDNCTGHNRGVVQVLFRSHKMHLCQHCLFIANRIAKEDAKFFEPTEEPLPLAA